jgi:hypothetical protein
MIGITRISIMPFNILKGKQVILEILYTTIVYWNGGMKQINAL